MNVTCLRKISSEQKIAEDGSSAESPGQVLHVFIDNVDVLWTGLPTQPAGRPGVGGFNMPAGNGFSAVSIGRLDTTPPPALTQSSFAYYAQPNAVEFQWQGVVDSGIGTLFYGVWRDGVAIDGVSAPSFTDAAVAPTREQHRAHRRVAGNSGEARTASDAIRSRWL